MDHTMANRNITYFGLLDKSDNRTQWYPGAIGHGEHDPSHIAEYAIMNDTNMNNETTAYMEVFRTEQLVFFCILFVLIVTGNISVLVLILVKKRRTGLNYFLMHLALADVAVGLIKIITDIVWNETIYWLIGGPACKVIRCFYVIGTYSGTFLLVALSIDMVNDIASPEDTSSKKTRARVLVSCAWVFGIMCAIPQLILSNVGQHGDGKQCFITMFTETWQWKGYVSLEAGILFVMPTIIMTACYTVIMVIIWNKGQLLPPLQQKTPKAFRKFVKPKLSAPREPTSPITTRGKGPPQQLIPKEKIKSFKLAITLAIVFFICWLPYYVFYILDAYGYIKRGQNELTTGVIVKCLAPVTSAANPIIFCLFTTTVCSTKSRLVHFILPCWCDSSIEDIMEHSNGNTRYMDTVVYNAGVNIHLSPIRASHIINPRSSYKEQEQLLIKHATRNAVP